MEEKTRAGHGPHHDPGQSGVIDAAHRPPDPGVIEGYELLEELHRGGQGVVYRALQLGTRRVVALKVLLEGPFASASTRRRFEREIEVAASLRHPNIVTILDSGLSQGLYFFAMEYIDGQRLDRYLAQRRPPLGEVLRLFEKVCLAVNYAHQRGVIHRDLKPPNILVDDAGEPHILDFGLAKPTHPLAPTESTVQILSLSGQLLGTVAYMSPEQTTGTQDVDVRSDVYSLGVVFYEALVGLPPYSVDGSLADVLARIVGDDPVNPVHVRSPIGVRIDDELATILLKSLEKEQQRRYQTAGEFAADLRRRLHGEPIEAKRASSLYMLRKFLRRYRTPVLAAGTLLGLLVGFLVVFAVLFTREREARRRADVQMEETRRAVLARERALTEAGERTAEALRAQHQLRRALGREHIQRGNLAQERGDLSQARDSYWRAMDAAPGVAANWALRRYYYQTPDLLAAVLSAAPATPGRLSPGARWAALASAEGGITVRAVEGVAEDWWVCAPGTIKGLDINDAGALAAIGSGWLRTWTHGGIAPALAARVPPDSDVWTVYVVGEGRGAIVVMDARISLLLAPPEGNDPAAGAAQSPWSGRDDPVAIVESSVTLRGRVVGEPDYDPVAQRLCVPTLSGVEVVRWTASEGLIWDGLWPVMPRARALRFTGAEAEDVAILGSLGDGVATLDLRSRGSWRVTSLVPSTPGSWEILAPSDAGPSRRVALATRGGRLGIYGEEQWLWQAAHIADRLQDLRWSSSSKSSPEKETLVSLDARGVLTHWGLPGLGNEATRQIASSPAVQWAGAADGSTALLALPRGHVVAYAPARAPAPRSLLRPRRFLPITDDRISVAISDDGRRALLREGETLHFVDLSDFQQETVEKFTWRDNTLDVADRVALSGDGELAALLVRSRSGDQQQTVFLPWRGAPLRAAPAGKPVPPAIDLVGAAVREIAFFPGSHDLLMARSNGQLHRYRASPASGSGLRAASPELFFTSESVPALLAFDRRGQYLAVAGEDQVLRIIATATREVRARLALAASISSLAFSPHDDVLLVRTTDGGVRLIDPATSEVLANWLEPGGQGQRRHLGLWISPTSDALLLSDEGGVRETRFVHADQAIDRNRAYAAELAITGAMAEGEVERAWQAAARLHGFAPDRARQAAVALVEFCYQRGMRQSTSDWAQRVLSQAPPSTCLRLGHAAYSGERFSEAREWLHRGAAPVDYNVDALTRFRLAGCDYLAGEYDRAAIQLAVLARQPDFDPSLQPMADLQRVSALVLGGHAEEARTVALDIGTGEPSLRPLDPVASTYASVLARVIAGIEPDNAVASVINSLVATLGEQALLYRDDEFFFAGELARRRGDLSLAAAHYQRCVDLARDDWPASWARVRLLELSRTARAAPVEEPPQPPPAEAVQ